MSSRHEAGGEAWRYEMPHYLLTVVHPSDGGPPPPAVLDRIMADVDAVHREIADSGSWVFGGGLYPPSTATTLRPQDGEVLMTDGPFIAGKEYVGGVSIVDAPDLDSALGWGRRLAVATTLPIEVRPVQHGSGPASPEG